MKPGSVEPAKEDDFRFAEAEPFRLAGGGMLQPVTLHYSVYGHLNPERSNVILVCHALSGSARVSDWWQGMFGSGRPFDISKYCVIGTNVIGSCYGSTGPTSKNPATGVAYRADFPMVSIGDMVRAQAHLMDYLGVKRLRCVLGGSIGGMQALQWATDFPKRVESCVVVGASPLSAMGLALNHLQRVAIQSDANWNRGNYTEARPPSAGLGLARAIAMCSYKAAELFTSRYGRRPNRDEDPYRAAAGRFEIAGYLDYQSAEFNGRFDANTYLTILKAMDTFDVVDAALAGVLARVLMIGISSDWLFPAADVRELTERMQAAGVLVRYSELVSSHGHDAFLANVDELAEILRSHESWLDGSGAGAHARMQTV